MEHHALDRRRITKTSVALRTVAMFEATKGAIALLLGCGLFLVHKNFGDIVGRVVQMFHINSASHSSNRNLWVLALGTLAYGSVGLTEAYGLWREREWAQWFSLLSTALYLPPELYLLLGHPSWLKSAVLVTNIVIILFMLSLCLKGRLTFVRNPQMQSIRTGDQSM